MSLRKMIRVPRKADAKHRVPKQLLRDLNSGRCSKCDAEVFYSSVSAPSVQAGVPLVCTRCMDALIESDKPRSVVLVVPPEGEDLKRIRDEMTRRN